jgi:hypothetical protein
MGNWALSIGYVTMPQHQKPTVVALENDTTVGWLYIYLHLMELFPAKLRDQWLA